MRKILTNLEKDANFVMTDDNDKVVAIIYVPSGEQDITNKVMSAAQDDTMNVDLVLMYGTTTDPQNLLKEIPVTTDLLIGQESLSRPISFDIEMKEEDDEDEDRYETTFYLEKTEVY